MELFERRDASHKLWNWSLKPRAYVLALIDPACGHATDEASSTCDAENGKLHGYDPRNLR